MRAWRALYRSPRVHLYAPCDIALGPRLHREKDRSLCGIWFATNARNRRPRNWENFNLRCPRCSQMAARHDIDWPAQ